MSDSFQNIFNQYYSSLCNYATAIVKDPATAEDIVQNLFVQLWENNIFQSIEQPERFLLKATKFKCIDYFRTSKTTNVVALEGFEEIPDQPQSDITEEDIEPLLNYFASKLPPKTRAVFLKSRKKGMTYKEIATEMDISVKTVENQMGQALRQMKSLLKEHNFLSLIFFL